MQSIQNQLNRYRDKGRRFRKWKKVVTALACVVVFCTVYALILPAITLEGSTYCDKKEHTHTDECYKEAVVSIEEKLVCTKEEVLPHTHTDDCYEIREVEVQVEETVEVPIEEESQEEPVVAYTTGDEPATVSENSQDEPTDASETDQNESGTAAQKSRSTDTPKTETTTVTRTEIQEEKVLVCDTEETEGHAHGEGCYEEVEVYGEKELDCDKEEHKHSKACYSNPDADVETAADWEKTFEDVTFTNDWVEDTLAIAKTQLGYNESTDNYIVLENGDVKGYTRYGEWYGNKYGDWCAMFVSFCLDYAGVEDFPLEAGCQNWILKVKELEEASKDKDGVVQYNAWQEADDEYIPERGNIIFFNWDSEADSDHVGIVVCTATDEDGKTIITTVEGNTSDTVRYKEYDLENGTIMGYGILPDQGYYCEMTGHAHDVDCYDDEEQLVCEIEEHIHTEGCEEKKEVVEEQPENTDTPGEEEVLTTEDGTEDDAATGDDTADATELTEVSVTKHWTEEDPEGVVVEAVLYANDEPVGETAQLSTDNSWTYRWTELEKYDEAGLPIEYSIQENAMEGYVSNIEKITGETGEESSIVQVWKKVDVFETGSQYMLVSDAGAMKEIDGTISWTYAHLEDVSLCGQSAIWTAQASEDGEITLSNNASGYVINADDESDDTIYKLVEKEFPLAEFSFILTNTKIREAADEPEKVSVELHKVDFGNTSKFLAGAEFDLYLVTNGAEEEAFIPDTEGIKGILKENVVVNEDGIASLELETNETYYLVETRAPNGYNSLIEPIGFTVTKREELIILTLLNGEKWAEVTSGSEPVLMVKNSNGYLLPKVGGGGTTTYITTGMLLMLSAICLMYTRKKRRGLIL